MSVFRTKRQFTMADIVTCRAKARLKNMGLAPDLIDNNAFQTTINDNDSPEIETNNEKIDRLIAIGPEESPSEEPTVIDQLTSQDISVTTPSNVTQDPSFTIVRKLSYPPELKAVIEAEECLAAQMAANLVFCTPAIYSVDAALTHLSTGTKSNFVVSLKVYLRSVIAQFMWSGTSAISPTLPRRPAGPPPAVSVVRNIVRSALSAKVSINHATKNQEHNTWAIIAQKDHQKSLAIVNISQNQLVANTPTLSPPQ
ncbi:hypothetical protein EPUL_004037 [Erysiphe pulchra]|uniref:Uncharacterized protein n=1 Tax=Erysiphe pulchra TaxID=225359 RepID=A0A2S4PQN8_9PEZI|nr:hypothetical protein EPUL_004037 [Erysiphe pulchra]